MALGSEKKSKQPIQQPQTNALDLTFIDDYASAQHDPVIQKSRPARSAGVADLSRSAKIMKPLDSTEKKTLLELLRMFADPGSTAKRYSRYAKMCWGGVFACAIAAGVVGAVTDTDDAKMILMLFSGIFIGLALYFGNSSKQVAILTHYCALNVEAAQKRLSEEKK